MVPAPSIPDGIYTHMYTEHAFLERLFYGCPQDTTSVLMTMQDLTRLHLNGLTLMVRASLTPCGEGGGMEVGPLAGWSSVPEEDIQKTIQWQHFTIVCWMRYH